jgi:hypothetical protein
MSSNSGAHRALRANDPTAIGPYRLSARLGSGGMGTVYLGSDPAGRQAAVKVLREDLDRDLALMRRFAREVVAVAAIDSPRVATLLDADPLGEPPWLATEYVPGPTLTASVSADGPLSGSQLRALAVGTAEALCAVHEAGVVHRDLKPSNIMLADDGPKIIDFGIVAGLPETVTLSGLVLGSVGYIAPELLLGGARPTPKADIFAWALTLVFAATGQPPFGDGPAEAVLYRTVNSVPDLRDIPGGLHHLAAAALDRDPGRRPSAEALLAELQRSTGTVALPARALDEAAAAGPATAGEPGTDAAGSIPTTVVRRRAHRYAPVSVARPPGYRVLLPAAGVLAALAVTGTVLVAAPQDSSGAVDAQRSEQSAPAASTGPTTLAPTAAVAQVVAAPARSPATTDPVPSSGVTYPPAADPQPSTVSQPVAANLSKSPKANPHGRGQQSHQAGGPKPH